MACTNSLTHLVLILSIPRAFHQEFPNTTWSSRSPRVTHLGWAWDMFSALTRVGDICLWYMRDFNSSILEWFPRKVQITISLLKLNSAIILLIVEKITQNKIYISTIFISKQFNSVKFNFIAIKQIMLFLTCPSQHIVDFHYLIIRKTIKTSNNTWAKDLSWHLLMMMYRWQISTYKDIQYQ
jgi:hypothetical protein